MARPKKVVTVEEEIEKAQQKVDQAKEQYDEAVAKLEELEAKRDAEKEAEIMEAIKKSSKSYDEIMEMLKG